jgi:hypothetical protein
MWCELLFQQSTSEFLFWGSALLRVLYQGYRKNSISQQLFKVIISLTFSPLYVFGPHWPSSSGIVCSA